MDERQRRQPSRQSGPRRDDSSSGARNGPNSGGLLSRYRAGADQGDGGAAGGGNAPPASPNPPSSRPQGGLLSRFAREGYASVAEQVRRLTDSARERRPAPGDWRASDYKPEELEALIQTADDDADDRGNGWNGRGGNRGGRASASRGAWRARDDEEEWGRDWDAGWETGTWDTSWAADWREDDGWGDSGAWDQSGGYGGYEGEDWPQEMSAASLAAMPMGRLARIRMIRGEYPRAGALLTVFLIGFVLTTLAPLVPLLHLGWDVADMARRAADIQAMIKGGNTTQLLQPAKLTQLQDDIDSIEHDLYELDGFTNVAAAPFAAVSHTARNYRLLVRIGYDLTAAADEGIQIGRTLLTPLQGGVFSANGNNPGITPADVAQARGYLADAKIRVQDAVAAYAQLDLQKLPSQLRPGSKYGAYLELLPAATGVFDELDTLLAVAPVLLGIGQPAYYLVVAMDRSELRPGGGFQGNYGIMEIAGGKQSPTRPLSLQDTYTLDKLFYRANLTPGAISTLKDCSSNVIDSHPEWWGPEPPSYFWWWPFRNFSCEFNWGLRDSNLSPDFPTNARTAMSIVEQTPGQVPANGQLQGVAAFTPVLIEDLLRIPGVGPITLPQYPHDAPVTADNLEDQIHCHQLQNACGYISFAQDRKLYTHLLSQAVLAKVKTLHGGALKEVASAALAALKTKDLEVYFTDPRAELILQQLGLASQISAAGGDGYFVVDTNDGGNKADLYVTERQEDLVTLLPNGGAIHRLRVTITYAYPHLAKPSAHSLVYADFGTAEDYNGFERVYMPGDATILGYGGYDTPHFPFADHSMPHPLTDYLNGHGIGDPITLSDVPGRTMVMGLFDISCHNDANGQPMYFLPYEPGSYGVTNTCNADAHTNFKTFDIEWYTPNAWTPGANGHGTYSELVEKQAGTEDSHGSTVTVTVYVDLSQLHSSRAGAGDWTDPDLRAAALKGAKKAFDAKLEGNTVVTFSF
jgi:hypothetical protein